MNIALGVTALNKCLANNGVDGIGVYTQALHHELGKFTDITVTPTSFGYSNQIGTQAAEQTVYGKFSRSVAYSILTGQPFTSTRTLEAEIQLFHAPDHYIPKLKNTPVIATIHDTIPFSHPEWVSWKFRHIMLPAFRKSIAWADHVITISEYSRQQIMHHFAIPLEQISIVSNGIDDDWHITVQEATTVATRERYDLPEHYLINVGTLQPRKNVKNLLLAYKSLPKSLRNEIPLVVVGREGWDCQEEVTELTQATDANIRWLQYLPHDELMTLVKGALGMIFPSLAEGFGLPVIEAFAGGTPVVTSNTSSLPEVAGDAALLIDPKEPDAIAAAMLQLIEDSALRNKLTQLGKQRAKLFSWSKTAAETLDVYQKIAT